MMTANGDIEVTIRKHKRVLFLETLKTIVGALPLVGPQLRRLKSTIYPKLPVEFKTSEQYWEDLYASGGNSGPGSYNRSARYKAAILNEFIKDQNLKTILEWGCGDGNQLRLATYPHYVGVDVSRTAISMCRQIFALDGTKTFFLAHEIPERFQSAECALSLDVVYHLIEDDVYYTYMKRLFASATRFVVIYAWNVEEDSPINGGHVRHRAVLNWVSQNINGWTLWKLMKQDITRKGKDIYPHFYIFRREDH
jgi:SAM-dependent methyltransferase